MERPPQPDPNLLHSAPADDPVERLLAECLAGDEGDVAERVEAACRRYPEHADELQARLRLLEDVGFFGDAAQGPAAIPERLGDFELLRRIGSGGMGVVYLAREAALDRTVALKLVRPEHLYFPESLERFRREVKVVAGLRHPGIVPVFAFGEAQGIPFFTMECVAGSNLQEVLARLQGQRPERLAGHDLQRILAELQPDAGTGTETDAERTFGRTWQETCLRMVLQAAEALAYVHGHGVLHRDLKPSNLMVTPAGRVMLLDFGLSAAEGVARLTRSGALAGSLPYMSPEQLRGGGAVLDARTDVYSLGVTLYELLTLRCPYLGRDAEDTRRLIQAGSVPLLRQHNRAVSWDVETVCQKAMDRDPGRRYATAQELAQDLRNVLEYRPITARRPGTFLRVRRFAQRRPAVAVGATLGSLVLFGAPISWGILEHGAVVRIESQRTRAERNLGEALKAINQMLTRVGGSKLRHVPQSDGVRRELLEDALAYCRRLVAEHPSHREILREMARALEKGGFIHGELGDRKKAELTLIEAVERYEVLLRDEHEPPSSLKGLATAERYLASLLDDAHDQAQAEVWMRRSLGHWQELQRRFPGDAECDGWVGESHANLGCILHTMGRGPEAAQSLRTAVEQLESVVARRPQDDYFRKSLVSALTASGWARFRDQPEQAEDFLRRAVALAQELVTKSPDNEEHADKLANATTFLGDLYKERGDLAEARKTLSAALAVREDLVARFPDRVILKVNLGYALNNLAAVLIKQGDDAGAHDFLVRAIEQQQAAVAADPARLQARRYLHNHRFNLAMVLFRLGRPDDILRLAEPAEDLEARDQDSLIERAELLCLCVRAAEAEQAGSDGDLTQRIDALGSRAVACLRLAVDQGLRDARRFRGGQFQALARREDYRQLVLAAKAGPDTAGK